MMDSSAPGLERFIEAQDRVYRSVLDELALGHKETHWMWFIFPQLKELGRSPMAKRYGLASRQEALEYLLHPILGQRLRDCVVLLLSQRNANAFEIFGSPDDVKFQSCLTLFEAVAPQEPFAQALELFYAGKRDQNTLRILRDA
jgi:uncharacterized protein (DUF1810 family)